MKKLLTSFFAASLGLAALASCNNQKSGETVSSKDPDPTSSTVTNNEIEMKKTHCYLDGLNKSKDLNEFFEFKGSASIGNLEFSSMDFEDKKIISLSGYTFTSIGYGETTLMPEVKQSAPYMSSNSFKTIHIRVLNVKDMVHAFVSSNTGTSLMGLEAKEDGTFLFTRTAGTIPSGSDFVNVSEANIEGTYQIGEDGVFVFTPNTADYCPFKATIEYDKTDGSEYHLNVYTPLDKENIDYTGIKFTFSK